MKKGLVSNVHSQGYVRLEAVAAEMALSDEDSQEKAFLEVSHVSSVESIHSLFHRQVPRETPARRFLPPEVGLPFFLD